MKTITGIAIFCVLMGSAAAYSATERRIEGLVIYTAGDKIEVKRGRKETTLHFSGDSKVKKMGVDVDRGAVEICQRVRVRYAVREGRNEVISLDILAGSYCVKE